MAGGTKRRHRGAVCAISSCAVPLGPGVLRLFAKLQRSIALGTPDQGNPTGSRAIPMPQAIKATYPALPDPLCKWGAGAGPRVAPLSTVMKEEK